MSTNKIRIVFVLPTLKAGGAERVVSFIAHNLDKKLFESHLIVIGYAKDIAFNINDINVTFLNKSRVLYGIWGILNYIRANKPDIVFGSISHVSRILAMLSIFFKKVKFISREASVSSAIKLYSQNKKSFRKFYKHAFRDHFKYMDAVICQSTDMANDLIEFRHVNQNKITIINNPINSIFSVKQPQNNSVKQLITVGRLSKEKGHSRLLDIISKLKIPYHYTIIGDGPEKETIISHAKKLQIDSNITYVDFTNDVETYLLKSDAFLQGSFVEGFPNSLLESCAVGVPIIAFNAPGGTKEIIEININGYLVETKHDYLNKLEILLQKQWDHEAVSQSVKQKFDSITILKQYETLFKKLVTR